MNDIATAVRSWLDRMFEKFAAKGHKAKMVVEPRSAQDVANMEMVLRLKLQCHPDLARELEVTGEGEIIEDASSRARRRNLFWRAALKDGAWVGENVLGKLWMKLRDENRKRRSDTSPVERQP
jgi:predicted NAD-dependent protein-ADP-ribosyltransferase YbiA (DUF1768 family)